MLGARSWGRRVHCTAVRFWPHIGEGGSSRLGQQEGGLGRVFGRLLSGTASRGMHELHRKPTVAVEGSHWCSCITISGFPLGCPCIPLFGVPHWVPTKAAQELLQGFSQLLTSHAQSTCSVWCSFMPHFPPRYPLVIAMPAHRCVSEPWHIEKLLTHGRKFRVLARRWGFGAAFTWALFCLVSAQPI